MNIIVDIEINKDIEFIEVWRWFGNLETKRIKFRELKQNEEEFVWGLFPNITFEEFLEETCMEWSSCKKEYLRPKKRKL